jgi:integrase
LARSERYRDAWEASGKCDGSINPPPPLSAPALLSTAESTKAEGVTVERAVKAFLAEYLDSAASNTYKKYSIMMNKLKAYSTAKGYVMIDQWAPLDVREFRQAWDVSPITAAKNMSIVKTFFEFALCNEWITRNPGRLVKNRRIRAGDNPLTNERFPLSDDELKRMFEACETQYGKRPIVWSRKVHHKPAAPGENAKYRPRGRLRWHQGFR